jgi:hypothetical protein
MINPKILSAKRCRQSGQPMLYSHRSLIGLNLRDTKGNLGDGNSWQGQFGIVPDKPRDHGRIGRLAQGLDTTLVSRKITGRDPDGRAAPAG